MSINQLDAITLYNALLNGYRNLTAMEKQVNELNVFPVPDGDTGTNMIMTLCGGLGINPSEFKDCSEFMKNFSKSVLLSARGNSGVILSQYIRGWAIGAQNKSILFTDDFTRMMEHGVECAYGSVSNPVEGTMLTVLRESYEDLCKSNDFDDFKKLFSFIIERVKTSLQNTPNLLPVLKEAGVVDSGGMGILYFFEGILAYFQGEIIEEDSTRESSIVLSPTRNFGPDSVLEYGYCTEFVLQLMNAKTNIASFSIKNIITYMETIGDSIVAVQDDDIVKVHVHTFTPEKALSFARNYGEFITVKIENMSIQHNESTNNTQKKDRKKQKYAVIAVASGDGIKEYFSQIGANRIIDGGQTQNPSAQDFINAFDSLNAEHIVVLPNNSNICATAKQAALLYNGCDIKVIETKSIAQGYSALSMMNTWAENIDSFISDMISASGAATSISITKAVHDAYINGIDIKENMYIGIVDGEILFASDDKDETIINTLKRIPNISEKAVLTVFYGNGVSDSEASSVMVKIESEFSNIECGFVYGGQDIYEFHMALE